MRKVAATSRRTRRAVSAAAALVSLGVALMSSGALGAASPRAVDVSAVRASQTSVTVAWPKAAGADGYAVYRNSELILRTQHNAVTLTNLHCGRRYAVAVRPFDWSHRIPFATTTRVVATRSCKDSVAPTEPSRLKISHRTAHSLTLTWRPAKDNVRVAAYRISIPNWRKPAAAARRPVRVVGTSRRTTFVVGGLGCATSYTLNVQSLDAAGNHSGTAKLTAKTSACAAGGPGKSPTGTDPAQPPAPTPPAPTDPGSSGGGGGAPAPPPDTSAPSVPTGLHSTAAAATTISLAWTASTDNVAVKGYTIYSAGGAALGTSFTASYIVSGFVCGTSHSFTVDAYDAAGNRSTVSGVFTVVTVPCAPGTDTTAPSVPGGLHTTSVTGSSVGLAWNASTDDVAVTGYTKYANGGSLSAGTGTSFTATGLTCGTSYAFTVDAYDAAGNHSTRSAAVNVTTTACPDNTAPSVPTGLHTTATTKTSVTLAWNASTDNVGVTGYTTYRNGASAGTGAATSSTVSGLTCGTSYAFKVDAFDAAGNRSAATAVLNAATGSCTDGTAPSVPTGLQTTALTTTSVTLAWSASTDNVGVTGYTTYRNGASAGTGAATSSTVSGLTCGTSYAFTVDAYDAAGNHSAKSATLNASTSSCSAPAPPPPSPPAPGPTANLWVDTNGGSCVRQGTPNGYVDAQACSWNGAYQASQTGDLIMVKGGSYGNVTIGPNKASTGSVTFRTAAGEGVVVGDLTNGDYQTSVGGGNNVTFAGPVTARSFAADGTSNVTVDSWRIDCGGCTGVPALRFVGSSGGIVKNSDIGNNQNSSLVFVEGSNFTFENDQIHDAGLQAGSGAHTECMYVNSVTNLTLKRNHFYHCSVMDVFITGSGASTGGYVENNVFEKPWEYTGLISNSALAFQFRNGGEPSPDPSNWDFRYNTFVGPLNIDPSWNPVGSGGLRVIGNVFLSSDPCGSSNTTYDYNAFLSGSGCGTHAITNSLATYLGGLAGDFSLLPGSVLRDKGNPASYPGQDIAGHAGYSGSAPDLGAYEG